MKRFLRFDRASKDISKIKTQLSKFANHVYDQLWLKQGSPERIHIVDFDLGCENNSYLKDIIYGKQDNAQYDGIHLIGDGASRHLTYRAIQILMSIITKPCQSTQRFAPTRGNYRAKNRAEKDDNFTAGNRGRKDSHTNCEQAQYQRQSATSSGGVRRSRKSYAEVTKKNMVHSQDWKNDKDIRFSVPTSNRFSTLNQGN